MKKLLFLLIILSFTAIFFPFLQKKFLCPDCDSNRPPIAHAGKDTTIILPVDSVILDGRASTDDKKIASYQWTKISGPDLGQRWGNLFVKGTASLYHNAFGRRQMVMIPVVAVCIMCGK